MADKRSFYWDAGLWLALIGREPDKIGLCEDIALDRQVGSVAAHLVRRHALKMPDAIHLASAALTDTGMLHSYTPDLLALNGQVLKANGEALKIRKPRRLGYRSTDKAWWIFEELMDFAGSLKG